MSKFKYSENRRYFSKIDTANKAYILGFFYADASVSARNPATVRIRLSVKDKGVLEFILKEMKSDRVINPEKSKAGSSILNLQINSVQIVDDLIQLGCIPNKRNRLNFPSADQVPQEFIYDFMLGFFDGDGSVSYGTSKPNPRFDLTAPIDFLKKYIEFLPEDVSNGYKIIPEHGGENYKTYVCGFKNNYKIYQFLYGNSNSEFCLTRKKKIFERFANHLKRPLVK